jgi:putative transposase
VRSIMKQEDLRAIAPKSFAPRTTDSRHGGRTSPNLLKQLADEPLSAGETAVGDITYLPLQNGKWCYLATFQDKLTRRIIGWEVAAAMTAELVVRALQMALRGWADSPECRHSYRPGSAIRVGRLSQFARTARLPAINECQR